MVGAKDSLFCIVEEDGNLVAQLRGDLYRLAGEKARLQRENDVRVIEYRFELKPGSYQ